MTIQAYSEITDDKVVQLQLNTSGPYNYTIHLTETENMPEDQDLYLIDNLLGSYYNLRSEQVYGFSSEAGEFANRFEIVFQTESESLSQIDETITSLKFYYASSRNKIVVLNPNHADIKSIELYNIMGQSVYQTNGYSGTYNEYQLHNLSTGAYIIKMNIAEIGVLTKKVIVK